MTVRAAMILRAAAIAALLVAGAPVASAQDHHEGGHGEPTHEAAGHAEHGEPDAHDAHGAGADHGGHGDHEAPFNTVQFLASIVNFFLWAFVIFYLARGPVTEFLRNRRHEVEEGIAKAERMQAEAQRVFDEYSERLEKLDDELDKMRAEMVQAGEAERDRLVADAEEKAARMRKDAQFLIDQQMKQLRVDLTKEAIEAAVSAAGTMLEAQASADDQKRLADEYLAHLKDNPDEVRA